MMPEENHCLRCGALLPEGDEGICPACGTPFGRATQAMKVDPENLRRIHEERRERNAAAAVAQTAVATPEPENDNRIKLVLVGVAVLVVLLGTAAAFVL